MYIYVYIYIYILVFPIGIPYWYSLLVFPMGITAPATQAEPAIRGSVCLLCASAPPPLFAPFPWSPMTFLAAWPRDLPTARFV